MRLSPQARQNPLPPLPRGVRKDSPHRFTTPDGNNRKEDRMHGTTITLYVNDPMGGR
jgi:hypothetical protein